MTPYLISWVEILPYTEIFPPNCVAYRKDRNRKDGGVRLAVLDEIVSTRYNCDANSEPLWVDVSMGKPNHLLLEFFTDRQLNLIGRLVDLSASLDKFNDSAEIVFVSDSNLPDIDHDWTTNSVLSDTDLNWKLMDILLDHLHLILELYYLLSIKFYNKAEGMPATSYSKG